MNINLKLALPIVNSEGQTSVVKVDSSLMLTPYYATEEDIVPTFPNIKEEDLTHLRRLLFNASISVDRLTDKIQFLKLLTDFQLFSLKRDYVICSVTNEFAKRMNADAVKAKSQSKSLGDFSVSVSQTSDTTVISKIFSDSKECLENLENLIRETEETQILPSEFVKGRYNPNNKHTYGRLWWLTDLDNGERVTDGYASKKYLYNGNLYKSATLNRYSSVENVDTVSYYLRGDNEE